MSDQIAVMPVTISGLEPEEAAVERKIDVVAPVTLGQQGVGGEHVGTLPTSIVTTSTAGQLARNVSRNCSTCRHFNRERWRDTLRRSDHPAAPRDAREAVNAVRAALLMTQNAEMFPTAGADGDADVEASLHNDIGVCNALSEIEKDDVGVHQLSWCPPQYASAARPDGMWQPKGTAAKKAAGKGFDAIMRMAQGKK